jgi:tetratricopeptide (TPR) repeat protein
VSFLSVWYQKQRAVAALLVKKPESAIACWERILEIKPGNTEALSALAHLHAEQGRKSKAMGILDQLVKQAPELSFNWFNLGFLQQESEQHELALHSFEQAIKLDEKSDRAFYGKALSLIKLGRIEEAIPLLKKNTELQPMSPFGWYQLAHAYHRLHQTDRVAKVIRRLAEFEPKVALQLERETGVITNSAKTF